MRISVVLPCYNAEATLTETLDSINSQSLRSFELIAVDDGSKDSTRCILENYRFREGISFRLVSRENRGFIRTLEEGIGLSSGDIIARIDADDLWMPGHLSLLDSLFRADKDVVLAGTNAIYVSADNNLLRVSSMPLSDRDIRKGLLRDNTFIHSSVAFRKSVYKTTSGYSCGSDMAANHIADYNLWIELASKGKVMNLKDVTVKYRVLADSMSRNIDRLSNYRARRRMQVKAYRLFGCAPVYFCISLLKTSLRILQYRILT